MTRWALGPALAMALATGAAPSEPTPLLVTVGEVTATSAVLWARAPREGRVAVEAVPAGEAGGLSAAARAGADTDLTAKVPLRDLRPHTRYRYRVSSGGEAVGGEFVTAPPAGEAAPVTFAWSGDLGGGGFCRPLATGYRIFRTIAGRAPDFFLFVGDTVYADRRCDGPDVVPGAVMPAWTLAGFRRKHRYNRADPPVQELFRATSVYAIWDDHEVRNNFDRTHPLLPVGRRAFLEYWPIVPPAEEPTRLYRRAQWGALLEVFVLDTRQYRSPNTDPDGPGKTMLGAAQRRWLLDGVTASRATWKVIVSSVSLSVPTGWFDRRDSWSSADARGVPQDGAGFATERDAILRQLRARGVRNLVFVVADLHHAELIRHQPAPDFSFHEFIAGPLSASLGRPRPLDAALNPRSLFARGGMRNFGEVAIAPGSLTARIVDEDGAVLFTHTIGPE